jgi:hypothetical protein
MDQYCLRASRGGGESVGGAHAYHFVRAGDDFGYRSSGGSRDCDAFDDGWVIAAEISEYEFDAEVMEHLEQG